jgi:protein ImuB
LRADEPPAIKRVFEGAVVNLEAIFLGVEQMLEELSARLLKKESGMRGLRIEWLRINAPPISRELVIGAATRDAKHLWRLLRTKVEQMNLGYGVEAMILTAFWVEKIEHRQIGAWNGAGEEQHDRRFEAFLDTVVNRWGARRVLTARPVASHVPERARGFDAMQDETRRHEEHEGPRRTNKSATDGCTRIHFEKGEMLFADRPTVLLEIPEPADVVALQPDFPPSQVAWRGEVMEIVYGMGPERIMTPWWEVGREGGGVRSFTRDYYKVQTRDGRWLWVFREVGSGKWFVQGVW